MDFDGDGHLDIISGSYSPGHLYIFRGKGDGTFAKGERILNAEGEPLLAGRADQMSESLASVPYAVDLTGNGALDLVVGNISGQVILLPNEGTRTEPKYGSQRIFLKGGNQEIAVPGGDSGPVFADWTGNGLLDLIVGAGNGSVWLYRNNGTDVETRLPMFAKGETLIKPKNEQGFGRTLKPDEEPDWPGTRLKVHVTDYDNDGVLDLLVGDFSIRERPAPDLTAEQIELRDELKGQRMELSMKMGAIYEKLIEEHGQEALMNMDLSQNEEFMKLQNEMTAVYQKLEPLEAGSDLHGWVWLFRGKSEAVAAGQ